MPQAVQGTVEEHTAVFHDSQDLAALYRLTDRLYRSETLQDVFDAALDVICEALACGRASILLFDEAGVMRFVAWRGLSDAYRRTLDGHSPWRPGQQDAEPIFVTDIRLTDEPDWIKERIAAENIRGLAFIPLVAGGRVVGKFMTYYEEPHVFTARQNELAVTIARQVGFSVEKARAEAARSAAEAALRGSEERSRLMLENAPVMIWMSDQNGQCLHLNRKLRAFWGVEEAAIGAFDWASTMHPEDAPLIGAAMGDALSRKARVQTRGRFRDAQGQWRVLTTDAEPRFSQAGEFLGMIGVNVDVTEREEAAMQRELLVAELNHRVKNTLAVVQGIAHQTFRGEETSARARAAFEGRLNALAAAHNMLTRSNWSHVNLDELAREALALDRSHRGRIALSGPPLRLDPKAALAVAMALHELATNAVKYGALSDEHGCVQVDWSSSPGGQPGRFCLNWVESGGPPVRAPAKRGFGSRLIERILASDLDGRVDLDFRPQGIACLIEGAVGPGTQASR